MAGFIEEFKRGLAEPTGPGPYEVGGKRVTCPHCSGQSFEEGSALLNTPGLTLFGLDWANREASLLICQRCGRVEWFLNETHRVE